MKNFLDLAKERYAVRAFRPDPVEDEKISLILEAARVAPTARNCQPQKIYVVKSPEAVAALNGITPCIYGAPLVFVICYDEERVSQGDIYEGQNFGEIDTSIVCTHMILEACEIGLGSCWVGRFRESDVRRVLDLPDNIRVRHLLPVGYPDAAPSPRHTEYRPLSETVEYR